MRTEGGKFLFHAEEEMQKFKNSNFLVGLNPIPYEKNHG